ncbi:serine hydrolase domain-containing protein [Carboxylicivirga marina]|uniref:Beta-lactamase family protein n=1 Tax=Carboxylicivirga marina TaxID=2800988 RepID=A0ABS1HGR0_9BACT|nr:serine hydrolase domain-containing protein [Carboxylicivirga marina]MBK3516865.1 beta-lactamase family protein [Carboxylicivirga marina]
MKINLLISISIVVSILLGCKNNYSPENYHFSHIDSMFNAAVLNNEIPGAVALISHHDQIIYHKAFGYNTIHDNERQKVNDIFRLASMTKALTAVAVLQLQEQGKLHVDDFVHQYLPEFKEPQLLIEVLPDSNFVAQAAKSEITIHQLLTHTSGIGYGFQDDKYNALILKNNVSEGFGFDNRTSRNNIKKIAALPLLHEPGEAYTYGLSFDVLGVLIEEVSGLRYDDYITQYILTPCGMSDSYFIIPEAHHHRLSTVYEPNEDGGLQIASYADTTYPCLTDRQFFSGGADLCSTAKDYHLFLQMLGNSGTINGQQVLGPESVHAMLSKQSSLAEENSYQGYAAWVTNKQGSQTGLTNEGTYGFGGFFDTYSWTDPKAEISAVLLLQMYPNNKHNIHEQFQQLSYELIKE